MSKISELSDGGSLLASDYLIVVRSGGNVKVRLTSLDVNQIDLDDNEFIRLGNSQDLTLVHDTSNSIINQAGIGNLLIQKAGSTKLTINASGIDVTGSADISLDLLVGGAVAGNAGTRTINVGTAGSVAGGVQIWASDAQTSFVQFGDEAGTAANHYRGYMSYSHANDSMALGTSGSTKVTVTSTGNVGIGVSPTAKLDINISTNARGYFSSSIGEVGAGNFALQVVDATGVSLKPLGFRAEDIRFATLGGERLRIDANGRVGIGVVPSTVWSSSYDALQIGLGGSVYAHDGAGSNMQIAANVVYEGISPNFYDKYLTSSTASKYVQDSGLHIWSTAASGTAGNNITWSEAMRIDSSGNLLVGKSSLEYENTIGHIFRADGLQSSIRSAGNVADFNRIGSSGTEHGEVIRLSSNGTTVGSISVVDSDPTGGGGELVVASGNTGLKFDDQANYIRPANATGALRDNIIDLGKSDSRFKDLYLSGGAYLGGTGAANKLDDYEEGTWTPTLYYQNAAGVTRTYTEQTGHYTKIGNTVTVWCTLRGATSNSGSYANDNIGISGMPFSVITDATMPARQSGFAGTASVGTLNMQISSSTALLITPTNLNNLGDDLGAGATYSLTFSGSYNTTA